MSVGASLGGVAGAPSSMVLSSLLWVSFGSLPLAVQALSEPVASKTQDVGPWPTVHWATALKPSCSCALQHDLATTYLSAGTSPAAGWTLMPLLGTNRSAA